MGSSPSQGRLVRGSGSGWLMGASFVVLFLAGVFAVVGLPAWGLPMPTHLVGVVTPTCGLTRATVALVRGDLALAWRFNPLAFLVVPSAAALLLCWVSGLASGRWWTPRMRLGRPGWLLLAVGTAALWLNQQSNAAWIIHGRL